MRSHQPVAHQQPGSNNLATLHMLRVESRTAYPLSMCQQSPTQHVVAWLDNASLKTTSAKI